MMMLTGSFLISLLAIVVTSKQLIAAAEALGTPPSNRTARRYRSIALCLFMVSSGLLIAAALADAIAGARSLSEILGWSGIGCLLACVCCRTRYASVNEKPMDNTWDLA